MSLEQSDSPVDSQNFDKIDSHNESFEQDEHTDTLRIMDNQYVFIVLPSGNIKVVKLQKDTTVSLGKFGTFHTNDIIGKPFGHSYEIYDRDKIKVIRNVAFYEVDLDDSGANNQETIDDPSKQKLSYQDIEQLKKDGMEGQDIIKKVIESHSSFDKKTEYSKAKYIKRKESKFSRVFTPVRPTLYSVWEYFFAKNPSKIRDMRIDTLSQMLTLSNARAYAKLLVVDDTQGLLITGVMERLGAEQAFSSYPDTYPNLGYGIVLGIHDGEYHNYDIVRYMNFSKKVNDSLMVLSWQQIFKEECQAPFNYQDESKLSQKDLKFYLRKKANYEKVQEARKILWKGGFDGEHLRSHANIWKISKSTNNRELVTTVPGINSNQDLIPIFCEKPVLPGRTHPSMSTSGGGGYLLQATYTSTVT
ncbi:21184_t:CDS:10 [Gigaspora margarita]|uniref:tRNA (adenine(58)-N(1))-methyltransferase non-catalytic subunit TRM6 n=1 Tax=Gigaspora margarita TaxID=4874 RepID=A0ABN7V446_GIGMA|nr:21184_t:CDS:10 [Gigaspora margarita]